MDPIELLGLAAGCLTTTAYVPQVARTLRTGSARDFSLPMLLLLNLGLAAWLAYGLLIGSPGIVLANAVTLALACTILAVKLRRG